MLSGTCYRLQPSAPRTSVNASSSSPGIPTPTVRDAKQARRATARRSHWKSNQGTTLCDYVRMYPTPTKSMTRGADQRKDGAPSLKGAVQLLGERGPLNPEWVEWLMGFPVGYTGSKL